MAQGGEKSKAADKGKGKAVESQKADEKAKDGKPPVNGKKDEENADGTHYVDGIARVFAC